MTTTDQLRARVHGTPVTASSLRARVHGEPVMATATSAWNADARKGAAAKGQALPDGSYPIKDKTDWHKAKQALGRAKNRATVVKHLIKRAKVLGIPADEVKALTASSNVGMVAAAKPYMWSVGSWNPDLHPRGKDGKFIEKLGFVTGAFTWDTHDTDRKPSGDASKRAKVVGFAENKDDPENPFVVVESDGVRGYGKASETTQVAGPKGSLGGDDDKQLSLADAPIGGNKEMPADNFGRDIVAERAERIMSGYKDFGPALKKYVETQADYGVNGKKDDFGRQAGKELSDEELSEAIDELNTRVLDPNFKSMSGKAELRLLMEEQSRRGLLPQMNDDPLEPGADIGLDEGMLYADDQGRERYDANEAALDELVNDDKSYKDEYDEDSEFYESGRAMADEATAEVQTSWRADMAKVQQALEDGGWITSTPDADAPGGVFTYIDPDAPPELVALYQKLVQFGYANGWEP